MLCSLNHRRSNERGFTIIELAIVMALIGIIATIAIPIFQRYQNNSKSAEVKANLGSIRVAEEAYLTVNGTYLSAVAEPPLIPGSTPASFNAASSDFALLGWTPEGRVYFSYAVAVSADGVGYTADAAADIDSDGIVQIWGYAKPDAAAVTLNGSIGCDTSILAPLEIGRCTLSNSIY